MASIVTWINGGLRGALSFPPNRAGIINQQGFIDLDIASSVILRITKEIGVLEELGYVLEEPQKIREFLEDHEELIDLLKASVNQISEIVGDQLTELSLKVEEDPESSWKALFITVKISGDLKTEIELMEKLAKEWFVKLDPDIRVLIGIRVRSDEF